MACTGEVVGQERYRLLLGDDARYREREKREVCVLTRTAKSKKKKKKSKRALSLRITPTRQGQRGSNRVRKQGWA